MRQPECPVLALASSYPALPVTIDSLARDTTTIAGQWTHHRAKGHGEMQDTKTSFKLDMYHSTPLQKIYN
jgi:hypothetical protein